jgi:20S proteasome alpha/beta subunit
MMVLTPPTYHCMVRSTAKKGRTLTVCIGAICESGHTIVVAADRMMTYGAPMNLQVEMAVRKIVPLTDTTAVLFSGSVPDGENLTRYSFQRIRR